MQATQKLFGCSHSTNIVLSATENVVLRHGLQDIGGVQIQLCLKSSKVIKREQK